MEFLRRTIAQIKTQLGVLSISQKLVFILCIVIMIGACFWMVRYVGEREMVPLFSQSFTEAQLRPIVRKLDGWGVDYRLEGDTILVPKSDQINLISRLGYADVLPEDTSLGWSSLLESADFMTPAFVHEDRKLITLQIALGRAIAEMPGVDEATVIINKGSKRTLSNLVPAPSASVMLRLLPSGRANRKLATGVSAIVAGAVNRLERENIAVTIDGKLYAIAPVGEQMDSEYLELKAAHEEYCRQKIIDALNIPNLLVQIDATPQMTKTRTNRSAVLPEDDGSWNPTISENTLEDNSLNSVERNEPGMVANVSTAGAGGGGTSQTRSSEKSDTAKKPIAGHEQTVKETPAGGVTDLTATVRVPRSYFVSVAKSESNAAEEPGADVVATVIAREIPILKQSVMLAVGLRGSEYEDSVVVNEYWDGVGIASNVDGVGGGVGGAPGSGSPSLVGVTQQYGKHIAVGALAVISLLMMLMMVRKAGGPIDISEQETSLMMGAKPLDARGVEDSNIDDGEDVATGLLAGVELDNDVIRSQQILEQVRNMVDESPESAANLLGKWIGEDR